MMGEQGRRIRVLVASSKYPPEYAGSGLRAHRTYKRLAAKFGVKFDALTGGEEETSGASYKYEGVSVRRFSVKFAGARKGWKRWLSRRIEFSLTLFHLLGTVWKYDLFHVFGKADVTAAAICFAKAFGKSLVIELCNDMDDPHQYAPRLARLILGGRFPRGARIVCISDRLRKVCERHGYVENVWTRPNPVDEERFRPAPERKPALRGSLTKFADGDVVLCHVGKFRPLKNQLFLVDVLSKLPAEYKLLLAGPLVSGGAKAGTDREYFSAVKAAVEKNGLSGRVQIISGFAEKPEELMQLSDIYLLPSTMEACATPVLEAIACGLAVVANRIEGVTTEWIRDGENGCLSGLDAAEFAEKVKLARAIAPEALRKSSEDVLARASTRRIDAEYFELIMNAARAR